MSKILQARAHVRHCGELHRPPTHPQPDAHRIFTESADESSVQASGQMRTYLNVSHVNSAWNAASLMLETKTDFSASENAVAVFSRASSDSGCGAAHTLSNLCAGTGNQFCAAVLSLNRRMCAMRIASSQGSWHEVGNSTDQHFDGVAQRVCLCRQKSVQQESEQHRLDSKIDDTCTTQNESPIRSESEIRNACSE